MDEAGIAMRSEFGRLGLAMREEFRGREVATVRCGGNLSMDRAGAWLPA